MRLFRVLIVAVLPLSAVALDCAPLPEIPASLIPAGFSPSTFGPRANGSYYACANQTALVQLDINGPVVAMSFPWFTCANSTWKVDDTDRVPVRMSCVIASADFDYICPLYYNIPEGMAEIIPLLPDYKYCPDNKQSITDDGTPFISYNCTMSQGDNAELTLKNGTVVVKPPWEFTIECEGCSTMNKVANGTLEDKVLLSGSENYCPVGSTLKFAYGARIQDIKCTKSDLQITDEYGGVVEYPYPKVPTLHCFENCQIKDQQASGTIRDLVLESDKEQYCPSGEIVGFADGTAIKDLKCTSSGLEIEKEDGTIVPYSSATPPTLKCGPGVCTQTCSGPTTTTTPVPTTTTIPAYCPPEGVWSEWSVTGACASTCGAYNVAARTRNCTDKCGKNCPCVGPSEDVGPCGIALCAFPNQTCKAPYKKSFNAETNTFFCGEDDVQKVVCPLDTTTATSTVATTTTAIPKDVPPTAAQLWDVKFYYNVGRILHAFCADQACINVIQANGIGYDLSAYSGLVGRSIREDAISAVRAVCPTGSTNLRNLGFTNVGSHYEHNLSGSGLKQGWVSIVNGACGATKAIKRWKCHMSEDMMYDTDLEYNTYYKGLVQDGGNVQFYMY